MLKFLPPKIIFTVLLVLPFLSFGQATVPFNCEGFAYLFQDSPADIYRVDLQTGVSIKVAEDITDRPASAGYNMVDNYIWMLNRNRGHLIKVDANYNTTSYTTSLPNINSVDIDKNGIFHGLDNSSVPEMYRYDLNTTPPTALSTITLSSAVAASDISFNPVDNFLYTIDGDRKLFKINPATGNVTEIRQIGGLTAQAYGATYFDKNGTLYVGGNADGKIYSISNAALTNPLSTEDAILFSLGPTSSKNDGARCATAPLCKVGNTAPNLSVSSLSNSCNSNTVNLGSVSADNTPDGTVLTWHSGSPTTDANKISNLVLSASGTYYATFYDAENLCYSASNTPFTVTINPIPVTPTDADVDDNSICFGESVNLTGSCAVGTIEWYIGSASGTSLGSGSPKSVSPTTTTSYVATCKTTSPVCESSSSSAVTVNVNPLPNSPSVSASNTRICPGNSATLTAFGCTGTLNWSNGETSTSIVVSPNTATSYSVTCTSTEGCVSDPSNSTIEITIASINFTTDKSNLCSGESVTLTMDGCSQTVEFFADNVSISTGSNSFSHSPASNTTYTATCDGAAVTACATNNTSGVPVTVRTTPAAPVLDGATTICAGSSATLTATGCSGGVIYWSNSQTGSSITVSPSSTTQYTTTCLLDGCESPTSSPVTVTVEAIPPSPTGISSATICEGESTNLGGNCATGTLNWYSNTALTVAVSMPVSPTTNTTYYAICSSTNCKSSYISGSVTVNPKPTTPTSLVANPSTICSGESTSLSGSCTNGSNIAFFYDAALNSRLVSTTVSPTTTTTYYAACEKAGCKSNNANLTVTVNPSPTAPVVSSTSSTICTGNSFDLTGTCPAGSTIQWFAGVIDQNSVLGTGSPYTVTPTETSIYLADCISNANSCLSSSSDNIVVTVSSTSAPTVSVIVPPSCTDASNAMLAFQTSGGASSTVSTNVSGLNATYDSDGRFEDARTVWYIENISPNTSFNVTVVENGCSTTNSFTSPNCSAASASSFPVDLVWFSGSIDDNAVILNWETANESNVDKFEIERSIDAKSFKKIGEVSAENRVKNYNYKYHDNAPAEGLNYYRLKINEHNAEDEYSTIIAVKYISRESFSWSIYPNPSSLSQESIKINTNKKAEVMGIDLYGISGQKVPSDFVQLSSGSYEIKISELQAGTYLLKLNTDVGVWTKKIILLK